jgi:hypothetical protein
MIEIPNMVMIGGNSRHAGKTTLACRIISKLSEKSEVIALKVTSIRPGDAHLHGHHHNEEFSGFRITEETDMYTLKDTSLMLHAGARRVFYVRADEDFVEQAIQQFMALYDKGQPLICESRNLRRFVKPGLFLMMMRQPVVSAEKDVSAYLDLADKVLYYSENQSDITYYTDRVSFEDHKFIFEKV